MPHHPHHPGIPIEISAHFWRLKLPRNPSDVKEVPPKTVRAKAAALKGLEDTLDAWPKQEVSENNIHLQQG